VRDVDEYTKQSGEIPETTGTEKIEERVKTPGTEDGFLFIDGMHCSTCELFLESVAEDIEGVEAAEASYAADTMRVVYDPDEVNEKVVADALDGYGYTVAFERGEAEDTGPEKLRLIVGGFVSLLVMQWYMFFLYPSYLGIGDGEVLAGFAGLVTHYIPLFLVAVMTSVVLFYTGYPILRGAYVSLRARQPSMDLLVALAAVSAYAYSTVAVVLGDVHIYYDVSVAVVMVVSVGNYYEKKVKRHLTELLSGLTVLVVFCPRAMGLATPLAVSSGLREALRKGVVVVVTNNSVFEEADETDIVAFDKTGTLTRGDTSVNKIYGDEAAVRKAAAVNPFLRILSPNPSSISSNLQETVFEILKARRKE
jgi:cation transport ATPase